LVVVIAAIVDLHFRNEPPDVAGIAHSRPVVAADGAATAEISAGLRALAPSGASWPVAGPVAISDACSSRNYGMIEASWSPTSCTRVVDAVFLSDDSFERHLQTWDAALRAAGWTAAALDRVGSSNSTFYSRALEGSAFPGGAITLTFRSAAQSQAAAMIDLASSESAAPTAPMPVVEWNQRTTVSPEAVKSAVSHYRFAAVVTVTVQYYDSAATATAAPTATGGSGTGPCFSGSGTCN
jgi:hypothetical protein